MVMDINPRERERSFDLKPFDFSNDIFMKVKRDRDNSGSASVSGRRTTSN